MCDGIEKTNVKYKEKRETMQFEDEFFKTEERNDFKVSSMMKRLWAATMEVLEAVINVCDKNNIKYFADWGTMLGAVRHKGFIPWDDDIDICLLRSDYNKLINVLKTDLPYGIVLAGMYSDSERLQEATFAPHIRVMADETLWDFNDYMVRFHGFPFQRVGIDIFPLDKISNDPIEDKKQQELIRQGINILTSWDYYTQKNILEKEISSFEEKAEIFIPRDEKIKNRIWREVDNISMWYENEDYDNVAELLWYICKNKYKCKREWFSEMVPMKFENMKIMVPKEYDKVLHIYFGDYSKFVRFTSGHDYPIYKDLQKELVKNIRATGFRGSVEMFCEAVASGKLRV